MSYYLSIDYLHLWKQFTARVSPAVVSLISETRINYNSIEDALRRNDDNDDKLRPLDEREMRETKANRGVAFKGDRKKGDRRRSPEMHYAFG